MNELTTALKRQYSRTQLSSCRVFDVTQVRKQKRRRHVIPRTSVATLDVFLFGIYVSSIRLLVSSIPFCKRELEQIQRPNSDHFMSNQPYLHQTSHAHTYYSIV